MTSTGLDDKADRELARMEAARKGKAAADGSGKAKPARKPARATAATAGGKTKGGSRSGQFLHLVAAGDVPAGVYWVPMTADPETREMLEGEPQWICSPLQVAAITRDALGGEWGRLLVFHDRDGMEHRYVMPMSLLSGSGEMLRTELLRQGLEVAPQKARRERLLEYIMQANPEGKARCVLRTGWHDGLFVLPSKTYGERDGEAVLLQSAAPDAVPMTAAGTFGQWRDLVAAPCAGNSRLVLALSVAFAAPCLRLLDGESAEGGGFHLRGGSSSGKSTALAVAASVYGPAGFTRVWRATDNGLEAMAAMYSDLLLPLDEIGQLDPRAAGSAAYLLANGQGKSRSNRDGAARAAVAFKLLFLSSGEVGLGDLVSASGGKSRAGHEVRVIDVPVESPGSSGIFECVPEGVAPGALADGLKRACAAHHGQACGQWLEALTADPVGVAGELRRTRDAVLASLCGDVTAGQVRRVAARFALVAAAGELATSRGLTGWSEGEAVRAARACFAAWLAARGTDGESEPVAMVAQVREFIASNGEARFSPWRDSDADHKPRTVKRAGFRRGKDDMGGLAYYVFADVFRSEVCAGFDYRQVARVLAERGALRLPGRAGDFTRSERLPDGQKARMYVVLPDELEDDAGGED